MLSEKKKAKNCLGSQAKKRNKVEFVSTFIHVKT
jgi:hypothetical protein